MTKKSSSKFQVPSSKLCFTPLFPTLNLKLGTLNLAPNPFTLLFLPALSPEGPLMHTIDDAPPPSPEELADNRPWYQLLNRYHWFVLGVCALGWLFDCLDQQLFNLARVPAMKALLAEPSAANVAEWGGYATSIFLIGWASGGLAFGVLGDRIGRAKVMLFTILIYSFFTGLSAFSVGFWDFAAYRFLTGLGVGGEFAVGVALVAEVMPARARPFALGLLQALSAVGNITAAFLSIGLGYLEESGAIGSAWRVMFMIGTLPALLAILIRRRLKEPERWQAIKEEGVKKQLGSYTELFSHPTWRKHAIFGMLLAFSGVVGLWGIGFFSIDLNRSVFRKTYEQTARDNKQTVDDQAFVQAALRWPNTLETAKSLPQPGDLLGPVAGNTDPQLLFAAILELSKQKKEISSAAVIDQAISATANSKKPLLPADRPRLEAYLTDGTAPTTESELQEFGKKIVSRSKYINGQMTLWAGITSLCINIGAFLGIYGFSVITHYTGRKPAFAVAFVLAGASTVWVFLGLYEWWQVFYMLTIMGVCQLSLFGGYAIYFPELFPTRLRSTGTSFCYNVGRFVAASGPAVLGLLTSKVFADSPEPMRWAGVTMCSVFVIGLLVLPFLPETKGKPLPE
jgi:MFS family permease